MLSILCPMLLTLAADQPPAGHTGPWQYSNGLITQNGEFWADWESYFAQQEDRSWRCGTKDKEAVDLGLLGGSPSDCTFNSTNPNAAYDPSVTLYRIPCVVHVITSGSQGNLSPACVESGIRILNEDFLALPGTNGGPGTDTQIEFFLAEVDPNGNPTNGITYTNNNSWFNDNGSYWNTLAWDPDRYLNIYTNTASGALGYVSTFPQEGGAGSNSDRVVILYSTFGDCATLFPFNLGRTLTHEVGHYLGLFHTFQGGCGGNCSNSGDLICDTNSQSFPNSGCGSPSSCGSLDPVHNYMDYSDDSCMYEFTPDQARRMRCSLEFYRPDLAEVGPAAPGACCFANGTCTSVLSNECTSSGGTFEGGNTSCAPSPCPPPTIGSCCFGSECSELTPTGCETGGGVFNGLGSSCADNVCAPRACCLTTGDCVVLVPDTCSAVGGTSDAADCASSSCAPPACPEDLNDNGSVDFADLLEVLGSWGACGGCDEDFDGNGVVEFNDLLNLLSKWGAC